MPGAGAAAPEDEESTAEVAATPVGPRNPHFGKPTDFVYAWAPRNLAHKTLYYEDMPLERYGQSFGPLLQPVVSGLRFYGDVVTLPLQVIHERPWNLHYVLGLDRPGNCSPRLKQRLVPRAR